MPSTPQYSWTIPTVGGDTDIWGNILNSTTFPAIEQTILSIDDRVTALESASPGADGTTALAALDEQPILWAQFGAEASYAAHAWIHFNTYVKSEPANNGVGAEGTWLIGLPHLRTGQRITAFTSFGRQNTTGTTTTSLISLCYLDTSGAETVVSAGHALPFSTTTPSSTTTSGLTHDVGADRAYYIKAQALDPAGQGVPISYLYWVQLTITRP